MIEVTPELLERHDRPVPRYTSYPTALEFHEGFGRDEYAQVLESAAARVDQPLSLYVHLPFCQARCSFCACHVVVAANPVLSETYLDRVMTEAESLAGRLGGRRALAQYHWGGGTPTYHSPDTLAALHRRLMSCFEPSPDAEMSVEVDPRVTTAGHIETLADLGFNRVSLGVQDLDPGVQAQIGRNQTEAQTVALYELARTAGFQSINLDLIYGLPGQDEDTLGRTLDRVLELRPDRLAVYSFAYIPRARPHQKRIDPTSLPGTEVKFSLLSLVVGTLTRAGYLPIGMDHFALADDDLARAAAAGTLDRNFMGYTAKRGTETIALGTSGISDIGGSYAQNHRRLASYLSDVGEGLLPVERGYRLTEDDRLRRHVITELMCNGYVDLDLVEPGYLSGTTGRLERELEELCRPGGLVDEGMAVVEGRAVRATELGRLFVRRLARVFDAHTARRNDHRPVFSRSV